MVAQQDCLIDISKSKKLLHKADNYIGRKVCHYMLCTNNIEKITKKNNKNSSCIVLKRIFVLCTRPELDIRHSAATCIYDY